MISTSAIFLLSAALAITTAQSYLFDADFIRVPKKCYDICDHGACEFRGCTSPSCPGGACHFILSLNPTCTGGACTFEECKNATCDGGSCTFKNPGDTLKHGYCNGGNCNLNGKPHPDFSNYISI